MTLLHPVTPHHAHHSLIPAISTFTSFLPSSLSIDHLRAWYTNPATDPLHPAIAFSLVTSAVVFVLGELTGNVSQVDRLWTSLPLIYSAHFTFWPLVTGQVTRIADLDHRILLVFALQCAWSARLTYQSARRGFLTLNPWGEEDYRWLVVRKRLPKWAFSLLDLVFIAFIQNLLLLAADLPQYLLLTHDRAASSHLSQLARLKPGHAPVARVPLNLADALLAALFIVTLALEMRADNEQQAFQNIKKRALDKRTKGHALTVKEQTAVERGFVAEGLWAWSRHPNFACEQATWYILYAFTVVPFLPLAQSFTSHPLSTLAHLGSSTPSDKAQSATAKLVDLVSSVPGALLPSHVDLDMALAALLHPYTTLRALSPVDPLSLLNQGALSRLGAQAKLAAHVAIAEVRADEGTYWNYAVLAPVIMSALFFSSTMLTEEISAGKYP
ncbi:uncharacterized protein RHOBADRAFT_54602 [Rhodotorula graminis WP1]|uniref:Steroid 5-alpha reductase C-terminal domain-containing protein n=1 Tax=Rhodotorula graminis (strain WP1) TaxID=578459 RepID=A0A0P9GKU2_RHOGW|nr:uncharacterized protein RHOBADRAFT_54602 [Rhodotorula graminis WP1]KPV74034.1 hypothetical protein RHOBADRAFT_54602 [Rhodotorula graminis WP1]